jgi:hypothetical protein
MMYGKTKWSRVSGTFSVELFYYDGKEPVWERQTWDNQNKKYTYVDTEFPMNLRQFYSGDDVIELVIEFESDGYYDPGRVSGAPEDCYPPEGDDERTLSEVYLSISPKERIELPVEVQQELFDYLYEEIEEVEIDTSGD